MVRMISALLGLVLCNPLWAADKGPALPDYPADRVAANTWVIHGPIGYPSPENQGFMNNPAFVVTAEGVVVIDPGSSLQSGEMVMRQIRTVTDKPVIALLNTHVHGDHWLGNHAFRNADPEVPIYGHPKMLERVAQGAGLQWVDLMLRASEGATAGTDVRGPNIAIGHGESLTFGGVEFKFHHPGPSHTDNDLMIEIPSEKVLFLADNVCNERIVRMDDGTFRGSVAVADYALTIPVEVYVPGHGQTNGAGFVRDYRDYMKELYGHVKTLYDEGMSDYEMKPIIKEKLARFDDWTGFEDELGKHISLAVLEAEQAMFE